MCVLYLGLGKPVNRNQHTVDGDFFDSSLAEELAVLVVKPEVTAGKVGIGSLCNALGKKEVIIPRTFGVPADAVILAEDFEIGSILEHKQFLVLQ